MRRGEDAETGRNALQSPSDVRLNLTFFQIMLSALPRCRTTWRFYLIIKHPKSVFLILISPPQTKEFRAQEWLLHKRQPTKNQLTGQPLPLCHHVSLVLSPPVPYFSVMSRFSRFRRYPGSLVGFDLRRGCQP